MILTTANKCYLVRGLWRYQYTLSEAVAYVHVVDSQPGWNGPMLLVC